MINKVLAILLFSLSASGALFAFEQSEVYKYNLDNSALGQLQIMSIPYNHYKVPYVEVNQVLKQKNALGWRLIRMTFFLEDNEIELTWEITETPNRPINQEITLVRWAEISIIQNGKRTITHPDDLSRLDDHIQERLRTNWRLTNVSYTSGVAMYIWQK